jgi:hypothetical protein
MQQRIAQARTETQRLLDKAVSYSPQFRKPAQVEYYRAHIAYLDKRAAGVPCDPPVANAAKWDTMQCVLDAEARVAQAS